MNSAQSNPVAQAGLAIPVTRKCRDCGETKEAFKFVKNKTFSHGIDTLCLECNHKRVKEYRAAGKRDAAAESRRYSQRYPEKVAARAAKHRAYRRKCVPNWLTEDDLWIIEEAYLLAKLREKITGVKWHVDHIIPLKSKYVCGLHVPNNIQVIPAKLNMIKGNSYDGIGKHRVTG